jgi:2-keto-4-pentenoate hydratase/2-oxohepta-3-ene-1,7-dioic acid hydratase in catechol pathway
MICERIVRPRVPDRPERSIITQQSILKASIDYCGFGMSAPGYPNTGSGRADGRIEVRVANVGGRLVLLEPQGFVDVEKSSAGRFSASPQSAYESWTALREWAAGRDVSDDVLCDGSAETALGPPVPRPGQVFAVALNYRAHALEANLALPDRPLVFTKFPSCLAEPVAQVALPDGSVDWEAELVVVIGQTAHHVPESDAWSVVAGLTVGQDISERQLQIAGAAPQFSMGKSFPNFGPIGPWVVTPDEFDDPNDIRVSCWLEGGEVLQDGRTSDLIFPIARLIADLSSVCTLWPGDLIFTGTPAGVGAARKPPQYLTRGDVLITEIDNIGRLRTTFH